MFWVYLFQILIMVVIPAVQTLLKYLGIMAVAYVGISFALNQLTSYVHSYFLSSPLVFQQFAGLAKFDVGINIYLSAVLAKFVMQGLNKASDKKKSFTFKA